MVVVALVAVMSGVGASGGSGGSGDAGAGSGGCSGGGVVDSPMVPRSPLPDLHWQPKDLLPSQIASKASLYTQHYKADHNY